MRKITDLVEDALNYPDYDRRINFLLAGLLSEDANDTPYERTVYNKENPSKNAIKIRKWRAKNNPEK